MVIYMNCYINWNELAKYLNGSKSILCILPKILRQRISIKSIYERHPEHPFFSMLKYNLLLLVDIVNNLVLGISYTGRREIGKNICYEVTYPRNLKKLIREKWLLTYGSINPVNYEDFNEIQRRYIENYFYYKTILHRFFVYKLIGNKLILSNKTLSLIRDPENPSIDVSIGLITGRIIESKNIVQKKGSFMGLYPVSKGVLNTYYIGINPNPPPLIHIKRGYISVESLIDELEGNGVYLVANIYDGERTRNIIIDKLELSDEEFKRFLAGNLSLLTYYAIYIYNKVYHGHENAFIKLNRLVKVASTILFRIFNSFSNKEVMNEQNARKTILEAMNRSINNVFYKRIKNNTIEISLLPSKPLFRRNDFSSLLTRSWLGVRATRIEKITQTLKTGNIGWGEYFFIHLIGRGCMIVI